MKKIIALLAIICCLFVVFAEEEKAATLEDLINNFSYIIGAQSFVNNYYEYNGLNVNYFAQGALDIAKGNFNVTNEQMQQTFDLYAQYMQAVEDSKNALAQENLKKAEDFLAGNKTKKGITTTSSGLQYQITKKGYGRKATGTSNVAVYYTLKLLDGTVIESVDSKSGDPVSFNLSQVIPGFSEACTSAPAGSTLTAWIHPDLGYGTSGSGSKIGPNELLIFEIQIVSVN